VVVIKIVATADNHLGRYYDRMLPSRLADRRRYLRRGFHSAVEYAIEHEAQLFLQLGDLFDSPDPRNVERDFVASELARLRKHGVQCFGIGGNHDTPRMRTEQGGTLPQAVYARLGGMRLFEPSIKAEFEMLELNGKRVALGGISWNHTLRPGEDPLSVVQAGPPADVCVLLAHSSVEGHIYPSEMEPVTALATLEALPGIDLVLLGHVHRHRVFHLGSHTAVMVGATERMTFGSGEGSSGFVYMELDGSRIARCDFVPTGSQPRCECVVRTTELGEEPPGEIASRLEPLCTPQTLVKLHIEGPINRADYHRLDLRRIYEFGIAHCFHFDVDTAGLWVEDEAGGMAGGVRFSQKEELTLFANEILREAPGDDERGLLHEALNAILSHY
jgi:DNA repair protein SbcD/Mre11